MTTQNPIQKKDEKNENATHSKGGLTAGLGIAVAMALGATLGILFAPKEGTETQKDIMEKAHELAKKFKKSRKEVQETLKNIFGEVTKELEENYLELQGNILAQLDDIKDELTEKKYYKIVQDAVTQFSEDKKWTEKSIHSLVSELQKDWK